MNRLRPQNIKQMIFDGEGMLVDFKKTITSCSKIAKTLVAFANNKGGKLLIGIADNGSVKGVRSEDEEKYMITKAATYFCRPMVDVQFEEVYVENKLVLVADVRESDTKPHYSLGEDNKWWVYVRVKDKSLLASKIVVDVLKASQGEAGVLIEYSDKERTLLQYLDANERISARDSSKLLNLPRRRTQKLLVTLVLSGIIKLHTTETEEYYTAS
ncbi:MAG: helix-turn-helix domain-containing protein [Arcticibacter sp.]